MQIAIPPRVRKALYIVTAIGAPIMAYLQIRGVIGDAEMGLWAAEVTVVAALAGFNTGDPVYDGDYGDNY